MKKNVNISTLKSRLSEFLKLVKSGTEVIITDRQQPIAKVIAFSQDGEIELSKARGDRKLLEKLSKSSRTKLSTSTLDLLLEDRKKR